MAHSGAEQTHDGDAGRKLPFSFRSRADHLVEDYLDAICSDLGLTPQTCNVLDWGCGLGGSVFWLRQRGYNCFGVDINPSLVENGQACLAERGADPNVLSVLEKGRHASFPDGHFHFVFSESVLEHCEDLSAVGGEMSRLTMPSGGGVHRFPGRWQPIEGHLLMPFVHWLPCGLPQRLALRACTCLSIGSDWGWPRRSLAERLALADHMYDMWTSGTFYRPARYVAGAFTDAGFVVRYLPGNRAAVNQSRPLAVWLRTN